MSDDTPTQRYPEGFPPPQEPHHEPAPPTAPTERLYSPEVGDPYAAGAATPDAAGWTPQPVTQPTTTGGADGGGNTTLKWVIIGLAALAAVLLIVVIVLLTLPGDDAPAPVETPTDTPTASDTPTPDPTPTDEETPDAPPPPAPPADVIASYTASSDTADCTASGGGSVGMTFSWATSGTRLWFGVGTDDAKAQPYGEFPTNGSIDIDYQCGQDERQQRYTITVERSDGSLQHETITIREI